MNSDKKAVLDAIRDEINDRFDNWDLCILCAPSGIDPELFAHHVNHFTRRVRELCARFGVDFLATDDTLPVWYSDSAVDAVARQYVTYYIETAIHTRAHRVFDTVTGIELDLMPLPFALPTEQMRELADKQRRPAVKLRPNDDVAGGYVLDGFHAWSVGERVYFATNGTPAFLSRTRVPEERVDNAIGFQFTAYVSTLERDVIGFNADDYATADGGKFHPLYPVTVTYADGGRLVFSHFDGGDTHILHTTTNADLIENMRSFYLTHIQPDQNDIL